MPDSLVRSVYFVSESTGITSETLGSSLLSQFPTVKFQRRYLPFTNSLEKAQKLVWEIEKKAEETGHRPLVFATMPDDEINALLKTSNCHYYEIFEKFVSKIGDDLGVVPTRATGQGHGLMNDRYDQRIDTVNYTLMHDDAMSLKNLDESDVILLGVSRSGKTPTCLYLALHYGIKAANYPLTDDDFENGSLPASLVAVKEKLVAISISPQRLQQVREKRKLGSVYARLDTCKREVATANRIFSQYGLTPLESTSSSIEELSAKIVNICRLRPKA